jgi:hypothetical protein
MKHQAGAQRQNIWISFKRYSVPIKPRSSSLHYKLFPINYHHLDIYDYMRWLPRKYPACLGNGNTELVSYIWVGSFSGYSPLWLFHPIISSDEQLKYPAQRSHFCLTQYYITSVTELESRNNLKVTPNDMMEGLARARKKVMDSTFKIQTGYLDWKCSYIFFNSYINLK